MVTKVRRGEWQPAETLPVARICVDMPLPHLDRPFDYLVPAQFDADAVPGCRVRVRFAGKLIDGYLLERQAESDHQGKLMFLERVVSAEPVLSPEVAVLARAVADRYAGTLTDVLRLAIPPRHAKAEAADRERPPTPARPDAVGWQRYQRGTVFVDAVHAGKPAHGVWQALPGEDWPARLAELAVTSASADRPAVIVVPDYRDLARLETACGLLTDPADIVALAADLGPAERYRRFLAARRDRVRIVLGTRAAAFAPVTDPGLLIIWDDGDDLHSDQRSPYPHVREVLALRAHASGGAMLIAGHARSTEAQALVDSGWAHEIVASREVLRLAAPRVTAIGEDDRQLARDPQARAARLPSVGFEAARAALQADAPVLVQVPRRGYVPALACAQCRQPARCRRCAGPLAVPDGPAGEARPPACRWCGATEAGFVCDCGSRRLRAMVVGAKRTAEELGRAFPGIPVRTSGGGEVLTEVKPGKALVISTPGAEPVAEGGYGAALLLDGWSLLSRPDLRVAETALRRWLAAAALVRSAADGGRVVVVADSGLQPVQALIRWDPVWHARLELAERTELGYPPAVRMATVDGLPDPLQRFLDEMELPEQADLLGPVPLERPGPDGTELERALIRVPRGDGRALSAALSAARSLRAVRKESDPVRIRLDPLEII
ncbi:primosomal protein N' [Pseudonocardiaceae bacterium YIM PH 21723]|nr:primosomal protein N' [Pseudonocardiaceae bacterium YIM PH 21723]